MSSAAKTASESSTSNAGPEAANDPGVDPRLLEILVCPVTRSALTYDREANELVSRAAGLAFPIRNGVPVMLRDEARDIGAAKYWRPTRRPPGPLNCASRKIGLNSSSASMTDTKPQSPTNSCASKAPAPKQKAMAATAPLRP